MNLPGIEFGWLHRFALLVPVMALFAAGPETAQASCGDYLASHGDTETQGFAHAIGADRGDAVERSAVAEDPRPGTPCDGPACRRGPDFPAPPAPAPVVTGSFDQDGLPGTDETWAAVPPGSPLEGGTLLHPRDCRQRMERPPRV